MHESLRCQRRRDMGKSENKRQGNTEAGPERQQAENSCEAETGDPISGFPQKELKLKDTTSRVCRGFSCHLLRLWASPLGSKPGLGTD